MYLSSDVVDLHESPDIPLHQEMLLKLLGRANQRYSRAE